MELARFDYNTHHVLYPEFYFPFLKEVFFLDIYRTDLLRPNYTVLDLGASTGDFCIIASKKVGEKGRVIAIEPNAEDYEILKLNIQRNNCQNIIPLNLAVGSECTEKETTFWGRKSVCKVNTLENILDTLKINGKIDFIKMDIEGFEVDVIRKSIGKVKEANIISLEFHQTKEKIDTLLLPHGYDFKPITMSYIYRKIIKNLFLHPKTLFNVYVHTIRKNGIPRALHKAITGFDMTKDELLVGSYIKSISQNYPPVNNNTAS
jgi:FkbM family methyltransferase